MQWRFCNYISIYALRSYKHSFVAFAFLPQFQFDTAIVYSPGDVLDYWGSGGSGKMVWRLSKEEIKDFLSLRSEFEEDDIAHLQLN